MKLSGEKKPKMAHSYQGLGACVKMKCLLSAINWASFDPEANIGCICATTLTEVCLHGVKFAMPKYCIRCQKIGVLRRKEIEARVIKGILRIK